VQAVKSHRWVIEILGDNKDTELTLYSRHARKLGRKAPHKARVVDGDLAPERSIKNAGVKRLGDHTRIGAVALFIARGGGIHAAALRL
jgi:hypothetical protein